MNIAEAIIKYLYNNGVRHSFGIPTSQISGFNDSLNDYDIEYIVVKNEAASTFSAGRYAEIKNHFGVCFIGGAVGVGNAINGIADAQRSNLPVVVFSSYVKKEYANKNCLQELITTGITEPITKYSKTIFNKEEVMDEVKKALEIAMTPPYGPVHVSIPIDIQLSEFTGEIPDNIDVNKLIANMNFDKENIVTATNIINETQKGLILVGKGSRGLSNKIKELSNKLQWPIVTTPNAKGLIESDFKYNLGNYGFSPTDASLEYVNKGDFDCLLVLGSSLGQNATLEYNKNLVNSKKVIHVNWDIEQKDKIFKSDVFINNDLKYVIDIFLNNVNKKKNPFLKPVSKTYKYDGNELSFGLCLEKLIEILPENTSFIQDKGENMLFTLKYLNLKKNMDFQGSFHYASMGTGVAGVMGSYLAQPEKTNVAILGDGVFFMNGMEVLTAKEYDMPIIYIVVNNSKFNLVENGSKFVFNRSHKGICTFKEISIAEVCNAMRIESVKITKIEQLDDLKDKFKNRCSPLVIELIVDKNESCLDTGRFTKVRK